MRPSIVVRRTTATPMLYFDSIGTTRSGESENAPVSFFSTAALISPALTKVAGVAAAWVAASYVAEAVVDMASAAAITSQLALITLLLAVVNRLPPNA